MIRLVKQILLQGKQLLKYVLFMTENQQNECFR